MAEVTSRDMPTQIVFNAYYRVHPEDRQKFIDAVVPHISVTTRTPGCLFYVFAEDLLDPNTIHLSEGWADQAAVDRHHASEHFRQAIGTVLSTVRILDRQAQRYEIAGQDAGDLPRAAALQ